MIFLFSFSSTQDKEKFEYLYNQYKKLLLYHANSILHDYILAEDVVSEAYIRIYKNLSKIDDPTSNRSIAYIVTITRNAALTMLKKEKRQEDEFDDSYENTLEDDFNLEEHVISSLSSDYIKEIVGSINENYRDVFVLKYSYDMSHKEIGETLGISENNVTVRLHRAKTQIAEILGKEGSDYEK